MFNLRKRLMVVVALAIVLSIMVTGYAFAAANTVPPSNLGDGSGAISGYTIANVHYTLDGTNPQNVYSVSFSVNTAIPAGGTVKVRLVDLGSFYPCVIASGTNVTCTMTDVVTALAANNLTVVSGQ